VNLTGKSALITGASRGIGRAIALRLARAGVNVALLARNAEALNATATLAQEYGVKSLVLPCDLSSTAGIDSAFAECLDAFDHLDVLVNNAGTVGSVGPFLELPDEDWHHVLTVDLLAVVHMLRLFGRHATDRGSGNAVNVSSVAGDRGVPMMSHYAAIKAAINSLTRSLAAEWAPTGVRVNAVAPGWVTTDMTLPFRSDEEITTVLTEAVPNGRWSEPEDVADGVLYLASDAASMVTGTCLTIDGGLTSYNGGPGMMGLLRLGRVETP
jgi:NAD(P)-dependent dehydrogenase (short-subunit alcohol dehydrogenase family)